MDSYEATLVEAWEETHKKGQLTLWILLALRHGPKHMAAIKDFIGRLTQLTIQADDQSMYRALRRYHDAEMVSFTTEPSDSGPDLKVYRITKTGLNILGTFIERNYTQVLYQDNVMQLISHNKVKEKGYGRTN